MRYQNQHENKPILTLIRTTDVLTHKELSELESLLRSLGIDLPQGLEAEEAGIAILRFSLAKALRKHQLTVIK